MKKRFFLLIPAAVIVACAALWAISGASGTKRHLESRLGLSFPTGTEM